MNVHHDSSDLVQWPLYDLNTPGGKKNSDSFTDIRHSKIQRGVSVHDMVNQCTYKNK